MKKGEKDIEKLEVDNKAVTYASVAMLLLALVYYCYEIFTDKGSNPAFYSIITIYNSVLFGYRAIKLKESKKLNITTSIIWGILTIMLILGYFNVI